jgi:hypothetical protein
MEEQPHESPAEQPAESSDGQPKFFKSMNGMIAGATALLIAFGGLLTTWDKIFGDKAVANTTAPPAAAPAQAQAAADTSDAPEEAAITSYEGVFKGEPAKLVYVDEQWVLTDKDGTYTYDDELVSSDETRLLAFDTTNKFYLRWPIQGGMAEWSTDKENWSNYAKLLPSEPPAE